MSSKIKDRNRRLVMLALVELKHKNGCTVEELTNYIVERLNTPLRKCQVQEAVQECLISGVVDNKLK